MAKILILTPQLPYPPHQGTSLRNYNIIRGLAQKHDLTLLSFLEANQSIDPHDIAPLTALCALKSIPAPTRNTGLRLRQLITTRLPDMAHRLFCPEFEKSLNRLLTETQFDIVLIEGIEMARYIGSIRRVHPEIKIVFDDHNAETELQGRNFQTDIREPRRWPAALYSWIQIGRLRRFERWAMEQVDRITAVSEADKQSLERLLSDRNQVEISVIPNCIDVGEYQAQVTLSEPENSEQFDLVFIGKMDYRPNVDAVLWFADTVWPGIRAKRPSTTWGIIGQKPHSRLERLKDVAGITITGWVDDVLPYLVGAGVMISPFRIGSGTRIKLIEAMANGKAIVSTPIGAEGFPVQHNRELILAETAQEMETAVLDLLTNPLRRTRLGETARQFAQRYDWRQVMPMFDALLVDLMAADGHASRQSRQ